MALRATIASALKRSAEWFSRESNSPAYDAAGHGRRTATWMPTSAAINAILFQSADTLRARSRDMARKNPWAKQGIDRFASNAIGTGIKPLSRHPDKSLRAPMQDLWNRWIDECDAHGVTDFYGLQMTVVRAVKEAGEIFVRMRPRKTEDGLSVPLQLQLIEAEHVPLSLNMPLSNGNVVRAGIEFDLLGRRVAYHMYREHPGERALLGNASELVRVPAEEVLHVFEPLRPGQIRGVPGLAAVLLRLYEFDQYEDGELVRNRDSSMFSGFIYKDGTSLAAAADALGDDASKLMPSIASTDKETGATVDVVKLEPGTFQSLLFGEKVELAKPAGMGEGYTDFMQWVLRAIAAGVGITYEQLTGDLSGVNYSSIRAGMLEFRRAMEQFQHSIFVFQFCRPIWNKFIDVAVLAGALVVSTSAYRRNRYDWQRVKWVPQGWAWVDPQKEVEAVIKAIRAGLMSREDAVATYGYDIEEIDEAIAADNARADKLGLAFDSDGRRPSNGITNQPAGNASDAPTDPEDAAQVDARSVA